MVLDKEKVISLIKKGPSEQIKSARKHAVKLNMHLTGEKLKKFLEDLDEYENAAQKKLREKLTKSNRSLFSFLLRPLDKVFTAKGGSVQYNVPVGSIDKFKSAISAVADGLDIKRYLKKVVRMHYIIDPNSVLFIDIDRRGKLETHVIKTDKILWYELRGNDVEAIIFESYTLEEDKGTEREGHKYYRVLDEKTDRIFIQKGDEIWESSDVLNNYFKYVPAIVLGDQKNYNENIFESLVADILDDADEMLRDISVKTVHKLAHAYPRYWSYEQECTKCHGEGTVTDPNDNTKTIDCISCDGDGVKKRTNPSDELVLRQPQDGEKPIAPNVAGYVQPDLGTMKFYEEMEEKGKKRMFEALWGTTHESTGKRETATGRYIDVTPVQDHLKDISPSFAKFHKFMLDCYGKVLLKDPSYESAVSYGTRYVLDGPDDILKVLTEISRENVSEIILIEQRNKYLESEFQNDRIELTKKRKLANIEPFPTVKVMDIIKLPEIPEKDRLRKLYFSSWVNSIEDAKTIFYSEEKLRAELDAYIEGKTLAQPEPPKPIINQN